MLWPDTCSRAKLGTTLGQGRPWRVCFPLKAEDSSQNGHEMGSIRELINIPSPKMTMTTFSDVVKVIFVGGLPIVTPCISDLQIKPSLPAAAKALLAQLFCPYPLRLLCAWLSSWPTARTAWDFPGQMKQICWLDSWVDCCR